MKDATGELSMTAVAVVAIAGIAGLFGTLIWPTIRANIVRSTYCSQATNCTCPDDGGLCACEYYDEKAQDTKPVDCPNESKDINAGKGAVGGGGAK